MCPLKSRGGGGLLCSFLRLERGWRGRSWGLIEGRENVLWLGIF